jgi:hypothetical protein
MIFPILLFANGNYERKKRRRVGEVCDDAAELEAATNDMFCKK